MLVRLALVLVVGGLLLAKVRQRREAADAKSPKGRVVLLSEPRGAASAGKAADGGL
jgi:hypothetical protein